MTAPPAAPDNLDDAMLRRLAEMDMAAAEKAHAALMAAEATAEIAEAMRAYHRAARSARQTLMLKARLQQMAAAQAATRPAPPDPRAEALDAALADAAVEDRVYHLHDAVGRVVAASHPGDEARHEALLAAQDALIDAEIDRPDFLHHPLEAQVAAHCARLGLPDEVAARWRELPPAPWTLFTEDDAEEILNHARQRRGSG